MSESFHFGWRLGLWKWSRSFKLYSEWSRQKKGFEEGRRKSSKVNVRFLHPRPFSWPFAFFPHHLRRIGDSECGENKKEKANSFGPSIDVNLLNVMCRFWLISLVSSFCCYLTNAFAGRELPDASLQRELAQIGTFMFNELLAQVFA